MIYKSEDKKIKATCLFQHKHSKKMFHKHFHVERYNARTDIPANIPKLFTSSLKVVFSFPLSGGFF